MVTDTDKSMIGTSLFGIHGSWDFGIRKNAKSWLKLWLSITLIYFLITTFFGDFLGLGKVSLWTSRTLFYQWMAPEYPSGDTEKRGVSEKISVVLLTEQGLRRMHQSWPVPYDFHADIIDSILIHKPKSIFIDIGFIDPDREKDGLDDLVDVLSRAKDEGIRVFLASPTISADTKARVLRELLYFAKPVSVSIDSTRMGTRYSLEDKCGTKSAALAIYNSDPDITDKIKPQGYGNSARYRVMHVTWGQYPEFNNNGPFECNVPLLETNPTDRFYKTVKINLPPSAKNFFDQGFNNMLRQSCPPHKTLTVDYLLNSNGSAEIKDYIENKYIFYGTSLEMLDDSVMPPTNFNIPGVYLNAMALDNLLAFGKNYKTNDPDFCNTDEMGLCGLTSIAKTATVFLWIFISLLTTFEKWLVGGASIEKSEDTLESGDQLNSAWVLIGGALFVDVVLAGLALGVIWWVTEYLYLEFNVAPIDFIGIGSIITGGIISRFINQLYRVFKRNLK